MNYNYSSVHSLKKCEVRIMKKVLATLFAVVVLCGFYKFYNSEVYDDENFVFVYVEDSEAWYQKKNLTPQFNENNLKPKANNAFLKIFRVNEEPDLKIFEKNSDSDKLNQPPTDKSKMLVPCS